MPHRKGEADEATPPQTAGPGVKSRRRRPPRRPPGEQQIILAFQKAARPLLPGELHQLLSLTPTQTGTVDQIVEQLVARGDLISLKGGRFGLSEKMDLVVGDLSVHPDGFGFVTPERGGQDIYLTGVNLKEAWHGDRVVVRIEGRRGRSEEHTSELQ